MTLSGKVVSWLPLSHSVVRLGRPAIQDGSSVNELLLRRRTFRLVRALSHGGSSSSWQRLRASVVSLVSFAIVPGTADSCAGSDVMGVRPSISVLSPERGGQPFGQGGQCVLGEVQVGESTEVGQPRRRIGELASAEPEFGDSGEAPEPVGQCRDLVSADIEVCQAGECGQRLRNGRELITVHPQHG